MKDLVRLFATGFAMGSSDIVPGVSGGTIAFIFGVYEELVYSIKKITGETLKLALKFKFKKAWESVPFSFLLPLFAGIFAAVITLAGLLSHLLESQPLYVWSFFFGLIVASIWIVKKRVVTWDDHDIFAFLAAAAVAFFLVGLVPLNTPATPIAFFLAGMVAIIAMILPGVSGSFLLVLMGKYEQVLHAVVERDILTIAMVGAGAVIGIAVFSRFLSWLFSRHHDIAVAVLTGFMFGSLRKIWPWKAGEVNVLPQTNEILLPVALMFLAAFIMLYLDKQQATKEHVEDVEDKKFKKTHKKALKSQKKGKI